MKIISEEDLQDFGKALDDCKLSASHMAMIHSLFNTAKLAYEFKTTLVKIKNSGCELKKPCRACLAKQTLLLWDSEDN